MINENIVWHDHQVSKKERSRLKNQKPAILWFTGLSGSGKSTIANAVEKRLLATGKHTYLLDGDNIRMGLNKELTFSNEDRIENIRRIGEVAKLFVDAGILVLSAFISPFQKERDSVRHLIEDNAFIEVYIDTPLEVCELRDTKGLYAKARKGEIVNFTGLTSPYEAPISPEIRIKTDKQTVEESVDEIIHYLENKGYLSC